MTYPQIERVLVIHRELSAGNLPNAFKLAPVCEVSTKSIQRDLEYMRDRLSLPLEYDRSHFGYRYTSPVYGCPFCASEHGVKELVRTALNEARQKVASPDVGKKRLLLGGIRW